jgi:ankyrin repeat protein
MATHRVIQQRLFNLCRDPIDQNNDELVLLKNVLIEIIQEEKLYLIDAEDETNRAPLFYAIESGKSLDFLQQLLEYDVRITNRILLCAIRYGNLEILKLLHEYGADFRQSYHGLSLLHECILLHKNHLISFLIEEGGVSNISRFFKILI